MRRHRWIGRSLAAIGVLHSADGVTATRGTLGAMVADGFWDTVGADPVRQSAFWFLVAGVALLLVGALADALEREGHPLPTSFTGGLLLLAVTGIVVMPTSGFWLVLVVALGAVVRARRHVPRDAPLDRRPEVG